MEDETRQAETESARQDPETPAQAVQPVPVSKGGSERLDSLRRALGLTVIVLGLLALVATALEMRGVQRAKVASLQGLRAVAAATSVGVGPREGERLQGMSEWLVREGGYKSVAFFDTEGRVLASTDATEAPVEVPRGNEPTSRDGALWAPLRQGTGTSPWGWVRVTLPD